MVKKNQQKNENYISRKALQRLKRKKATSNNVPLGNIYMKFNVYLKNKGILKISIFLFKTCIDMGELVDPGIDL